MAGRRSLNAFLAFNFFLVIAGLLSYRAIYSARSKEPAITESSLKAQSVSDQGLEPLASIISTEDNKMDIQQLGDIQRNAVDPKYMTPVEATALIDNLYSKVQQSAQWMSSLNDKINRFDRVSNQEMHMINKLHRFLKSASSEMKENSDKGIQLASLINDGYQCNSVERDAQEYVARGISMDICSEIEWYKVAQLAWPSVLNIIDVGANKGYLGSLFLSLWGGGGVGLSPGLLYEVATREKTWAGSKNPAGFCKDGLNYGIPLYCESTRGAGGECNVTRDNVKVFSIDGSSSLTETMNNLIQKSLQAEAHPKLREGSMWRYFNYAASNIKGTVRFTKQGKGQLQGAGYEGGKIRLTAGEDTEEVNMISITDFIKEQGIPHLDLLKIDAEGNDDKVILGATQAIDEDLGLFTFEGNGVSLSKKMILEYDTKGYSCYSTSRAGLFKWNGECMKDSGSYSKREKGNVFCANRHRVPGVTLLFDVLSFPYMMREVGVGASQTGSDERKSSIPANTHALKEKHTSQSAQDAQSVDIKKDPSLQRVIVSSYINVKKYCKPWPSCIARL